MIAAALTALLAPAAALFVAFFGFYRRRPSWVPVPILLSCAAVTAASWTLAFKAAGGEALDLALGRWMSVGGLSIDFGLRVDGLSAAVLAMVSFVGALIHVYSVEYMAHDEGKARFFLYFHLFYLSMIGLLLSSSYLQMYLFWEGVGLASYLLIGFWFGKESARRAALKAFLTNRAGDLGFMIAILLMLGAFGTTRFVDVFARLPQASPARLTAIGFLLLWAATAKSAQFPLYVWLPDAMEGPTPVSALIHAATMVTAGVFMLARSTPLLDAAPEVRPWIVAIGAGTALLAAVVAAVKTDLKRILAYSTVSHLGLMTLAVGLGGAAQAVFHLVTHGFFKALLFLCAGNVLHAVGKPSAGIAEVGGLGRKMKLTFAAFAAGALSLSGVPPFAGFFSKDQIFELAFARGGPALKACCLAIGFGSSFYIFRMLALTFLGPSPRQKPPARPHEPGPWMTVPVAVLAVGALVVGWFPSAFMKVLSAAPLGAWGKLEPLGLETSLAGAGMAVLGLLAAVAATLGRPVWDWEWRESLPGLAAWIEGDFGWQALVQAAVVRPAVAFSAWIAGPWDRATIDAGISGAARSFYAAADGLARLSTGLLNEYLWWMLAGAAVLVWAAR